MLWENVLKGSIITGFHNYRIWCISPLNSLRMGMSLVLHSKHLFRFWHTDVQISFQWVNTQRNEGLFQKLSRWQQLRFSAEYVCVCGGGLVPEGSEIEEEKETTVLLAGNLTFCCQEEAEGAATPVGVVLSHGKEAWTGRKEGSKSWFPAQGQGGETGSES